VAIVEAVYAPKIFHLDCCVCLTMGFRSQIKKCALGHAGRPLCAKRCFKDLPPYNRHTDNMKQPCSTTTVVFDTATLAFYDSFFDSVRHKHHVGENILRHQPAVVFSDRDTSKLIPDRSNPRSTQTKNLRQVFKSM